VRAQFGRSHRSNQASAPVYRILVTDVGGERRFAASAAKRLQSLGALLKGDRRALGAGASLKSFDIENKWGGDALKRLYNDITGMSNPMTGVAIPGGDLARFRDLARPALVSVGLASLVSSRYGLKGGMMIEVPENDMSKVPRFLNRLLGLPLSMQKTLFGYFTDVFEAIVAQAKSAGKYDEGLVSLKAESIKVMPNYPSRIHTCPDSGAETHVVKLELDRGIPFSSATKRLADFEAETKAAGKEGRTFAKENGFYVSERHFGGTGKPLVLMATEIFNVGSGRRRFFRIVKVRRPRAAAEGSSAACAACACAALTVPSFAPVCCCVPQPNIGAVASDWCAPASCMRCAHPCAHNRLTISFANALRSRPSAPQQAGVYQRQLQAGAC
jgi:hypothetical protein